MKKNANLVYLPHNSFISFISNCDSIKKIILCHLQGPTEYLSVCDCINEWGNEKDICCVSLQEYLSECHVRVSCHALLGFISGKDKHLT